MRATRHVAAALQPTDPALLHYRSGGFYLTRARQVDDHPMAGVRDVLAGMLALADEPIAGGRHKVFGHPDLDVIPQTSTIASHLPRALGVAFAIDRARRLGLPTRWSHDALAVCSFGDASANHSTAQGAINAAIYTSYAGLAMPLLFVCEDNGWGISVPTPTGWIEHSFAHRAGPALPAGRRHRSGRDLRRGHRVGRRGCRTHRRPALLHLRTVRFMGHAGTDVEAGYRSAASIRADGERDPLLGTARLLVEAGGWHRPASCCDQYRRRSRREVRSIAESMLGLPTLHDADEVMAPLSPRRPGAGRAVVGARCRRGRSPRRSSAPRCPRTRGR